jgi:tetratricopeptide (TPR) repeat protein
MKHNIWLAVPSLLIASAFLWGDSWMAPGEITVKSPSGAWEATITPDKSTNFEGHIKLVDEALANKASAKEYKFGATAIVRPPKGEPLAFTLRSPWMPVDVVLLDDGTLVTFDQWHNMGYGEVCTSYSPEGQVHWARTLAELVGTGRIGSFSHSTSSINWRYGRSFWSVEPDNKALLIRLADENQLRIQLADGKAAVIEVPDPGDDPQRLYNRAEALMNGHIFMTFMQENGTRETIITNNVIEATALLERASALKIADPNLEYSIKQKLVDIYRNMGKDQKAIETGNAALKRLEGHVQGEFAANLYISVSQLQRTAGDLEAAEKNLRAAVAAAPKYQNPSLELANLLYGSGRTDEVDAIFRELLTHSSGIIGVPSFILYSVGDFYKNRQQPQKALDYYVMGYRPDSVTDYYLYNALAKTYEDLGNSSKALAIYQQLIAYSESHSLNSLLNQARQNAERLQNSPVK